MLQKLKTQKGFTLVELIVVIAVLGVVGSFAVPALTGYADTAKENQAVSETQACVMTATTLAAKERAASVVETSTDSTTFETWAGGLEKAAPNLTGGDLALTEGSGQYYLNVSGYTGSEKENADAMESIEQTAEVTGKVGAVWFNSAGKVLYLLYTSKDGITVAYTATGTTTSYDNTIPPATIPGQEDETPTNPTTPSTPGDTGSSDDVAWGNNSLLIHMDTGSTAQISDGTYTIKDDSGNVIGTDFTLDANGNLVCSDGKTPIKIVKNGDSTPEYGTLYSGEQYTIIETEAPAGYQSLYEFTVKLFINQDGDIISGVMDNHNNGGIWNADTLSFSIPRYPVAEMTFKFVDSSGALVQGGTYKITDNAGKEICTFTATGGTYTMDVNINETNMNKTAADGVTAPYLETVKSYRLYEVTTPDGQQTAMTASTAWEHGEKDENDNLIYYIPFSFSASGWSFTVGIGGDGNGYDTHLWDSCAAANGTELYITYGNNRYTPEETKCEVTIKTVNESGKEVSGAVLTLNSAAGKEIFTQYGGSSNNYQHVYGSSTWTVTLEPGTYLITENTAPSGYVNVGLQTFVISSGDTEKTIYVKHEKKETVDFTVNAVYYANQTDLQNDENSHLLSGIEWSLKKQGDWQALASGTIMADGGTVVEDLEPGIYTLTIVTGSWPRDGEINKVIPSWTNSIYSGSSLTIIVNKNSTSYTIKGYLNSSYCAVEISKVDENGDYVVGAKLKVNKVYQGWTDVYSYPTWTTAAGAYSIFVSAPTSSDNFTCVLTETSAPAGYTKAADITIGSLTAGAIARVKMIDTIDTTTEHQQVTIQTNTGGSIIIPEDKATNWAHKLTVDGCDGNGVDFSGEMLYWKGKVYCVYGDKLTNVTAAKKNTYYTSGSLNTNAAPDPITYLNQAEKTGTDYVVQITGKVETTVGTYARGDIVVYNNKAYICTVETTTLSDISSINKNNAFYAINSQKITIQDKNGTVLVSSSQS